MIVLNRRAVDVLFPNGSPIGKRIQLGWQEFGGDGATVVGVVEHLQFDQGFGLAPELQGWVSIRQAPRLSTGLMVLVGFGATTYMTATQVTLQRLVPDELRGRVMALWGMTWSLNALGGAALSVAVNFIGAPLTVGGGAFLVLAYALLVVARSPAFRTLGIPSAEEPRGAETPVEARS